MRILTALGSDIASPSALANRLELPLHQIVYHVTRLRELGWIELVEERRSRGTIEHFYRRIRRALIWTPEWERLSDAERDALSAAVLRDVWEDVRSSIANGTFDRRVDRHLTHSELLLDEQAFSELASELDALLERAHEIAAEALERAAAGVSQAEIATRLVLMQFEAGDRAP